MIGPVSTPSSRKWTVHPENRTPYRSACAGPWVPGKEGSSAGWMLRIRCGNARRKTGVTTRMKPARQTRTAPEARITSTSFASNASLLSNAL